MAAAILGVVVPATSWLLHDIPARAVSAPASPKVDETSANMLRVSWRPVARTSFYQVELTTADKPTTPQTVRSSTPKAQLPALKAGVDYTVRVRAVIGAADTSRMSPFSEPVSARTKGSKYPALLTPQAFTVAAPAAGMLEGKWEKIESATAYEVQYSPRKDFSNAQTVISAEPNVIIKKLDGGVDLHLRVRSTGAGEARSAWSTTAMVTTGVPEGTTPLRVSSFNVRCHGCGAPSWGSRREVVAALISDQSPDVVGLQEAQQSRPKGFSTSQFADLVKAVSANGPDYRVTQPAIGASKGTRIIYKPSTLVLLNQGSIRYSSQHRGASDRYAAWAIFRQRSTGKEFAYFSTHLEPKNFGVRLAQARQLARSIPQVAGGRPVVAVGDFNASQFHYYAIHQAITAAGLADVIGVQAKSRQPAKDAPAEKRIRSNFDSYQGSHRKAHATAATPGHNGVYLDYIFTSPMRVLEFENVMRLDGGGSFTGTLGSDHNMLRADIVLPE